MLVRPEADAGHGRPEQPGAGAFGGDDPHARPGMADRGDAERMIIVPMSDQHRLDRLAADRTDEGSDGPPVRDRAAAVDQDKAVALLDDRHVAERRPGVIGRRREQVNAGGDGARREGRDVRLRVRRHRNEESEEENEGANHGGVSFDASPLWLRPSAHPPAKPRRPRPAYFRSSAGESRPDCLGGQPCTSPSLPITPPSL
jgi:hypothetical protein